MDQIVTAEIIHRQVTKNKIHDRGTELNMVVIRDMAIGLEPEHMEF